MTDSDYYTVAQLANMADQSDQHIRKLCQEGKITAEKPQRDWIIPKWAGDAYIEELKRKK